MTEEKKPSATEALKARPIELCALLAYQEGAVVSRQVIAKKAGTVTVFSFDAGEGLSTHSAPYDALVYLVEGEARITIAEKEQVVKAGEFIILPAGVPHGLQAVSRFKMMLVMIKSES